MVIPLGNILLPLILWMTKKDKIIGLKEIGGNLLNFQIIWTVFAFVSITAFALCKILHYGQYDILFYAFIVLYVLNVVLPIFFAVKMSNGKTESLYPSIIKLIK
ncbi:DUF4870 domain-containing protein [Flavobacterium fluviatile]|uniref:DUF4870 domain-containing protein n=1 Tax=Flavobacterium fluviatile TaxID=1862387 RepID=UPI001FCCA55C|nr:DUF4870 domain-containing protein [Flavobacterium fluviatile]